VSENRVLRRGSSGGWTDLLVEELHNLYCTLNAVNVITLSSVTWVGNVARTGN
jgi:hypothetical protein